MTFTRKIEVYQSNGTTLVSDVTADCPAASFHLGARHGCLGGLLRLTGTVRDPFALSIGQVVKMYFDTSTVIYAGIVAGPGRQVEAYVHEYELRGHWQELDKIKITARAVYDDKSPEYIFNDLYTTYISPALPYIASTDFGVSGQTVDQFIVEIGESLPEILRTLEYLATTSGAKFAAGITPGRVIYFKAISESDGDIQADYTIASDVASGREKKTSLDVANRVMAMGARIPAKGLPARWRFEDAASIAIYGNTPRYPLAAPGVWKKADLQSAAEGYFEYFADRIAFNNLFRAPDAGDGPIEPWEGLIRYNDENSNEIGREPVGTLMVDYGANYYKAMAEVGYDPSGQAPSADRAADLGSETHDELDDLRDLIFPPVTETDDREYEPPFTPLPFDETTGEPDAGALPRGQVTGLEVSPSALVLGSLTTLKTQVKVMTGGAALPSNAVRVHYRIFDADDVATSTGYNVLALAQTLDTEEVWQDATGITVAAVGRIALAVEVFTDAGLTQSSVYPTETGGSPDWDNCPSVTILDSTGGVGGGGSYYIVAFPVGWGS